MAPPTKFSMLNDSNKYAVLKPSPRFPDAATNHACADNHDPHRVHCGTRMYGVERAVLDRRMKPAIQLRAIEFLFEVR